MIELYLHSPIRLHGMGNFGFFFIVIIITKNTNKLSVILGNEMST
jgi:hypothetical protein